jgi:hypothetical protein
VFCSDHVNAGDMKGFRGAGWSRSGAVPLVPDPGAVWDGMGEIAQRPLISFGAASPTFQTAEGATQGEKLYQTPVMELCDDNVWRGRSVSRGTQLPGSPHRNQWSDWGPIAPTPLADLVGIYTEWDQYQDGTAIQWGPMGRHQGPTATLYTQLETFKKDMTLTSAHLGLCWRQEIPANVLLVLGRGDRMVKARDAAPKGSRSSPGAISWRIDTGEWLAAISPNEGNAMLWVNRGVPHRQSSPQSFRSVSP